jgi:hypothetical protein
LADRRVIRSLGATWFSQRFMFSSTRHPSGQWLRDALSGGSDDE